MSLLAVLFLLSIVVALFMEKEYQMRINAMKEFDLIVSTLLINPLYSEPINKLTYYKIHLMA